MKNHHHQRHFYKKTKNVLRNVSAKTKRTTTHRTAQQKPKPNLFTILRARENCFFDLKGKSVFQRPQKK